MDKAKEKAEKYSRERALEGGLMYDKTARDYHAGYKEGFSDGYEKARSDFNKIEEIKRDLNIK